MRMLLILTFFCSIAFGQTDFYLPKSPIITKDTTANRPSGTEGQLYANDTANLPQYYDGSSWYSFLLGGQASIVNADISASAAIAYSKLNLTGSILNSDISGGAAIARSKISGGTADHVVINDGSGNLSSEAALSPARGGTGVANNSAATLTRSGNHAVTLTTTGTTNVTLPVSGTLATTTDITAGQTASYDLKNVGCAASVSGGALTVSLKQSDGASDPASGTSASQIGFRSSTVTSGAYNVRNVTSATSLTVSSGSTLGSTNGDANWGYVYAIDNAGTVELAISGTRVNDEAGVVTTTAEGGAGAADSKYTLYSTTARSNVPVRLLCRVKSTQTSAGVWATAPSEVSVTPIEHFIPRSQIIRGDAFSLGGSSSGDTKVVNYQDSISSIGTDITYTARTTTTGDFYTINTDGIYDIWATSIDAAASVVYGITINSSGTSTNPQALAQSETPVIAFSMPTNFLVQLGHVTLNLYAGDIVRVQAETGAAPASNNATRFGITRVR